MAVRTLLLPAPWWAHTGAGRSLLMTGTGDADFEAFFTRHYGPLVRSLTLIAGDRERAVDATQDAFIRAYARWSRVRRYESPEAWVRRVAINRCHDLRRSEARRERRETSTAAGSHAPADDLVGELHVVHLLRQLPDRQRAVAALFYVEDLSIEEIAATLRISQGAVKFHLHEARRRLRAVVAEAVPV